MTDILITATLEDEGGFTDDSIVNSFAFRGPGEADELADVLADHVIQFYNSIPAGGAIAPISSFISSRVTRTAGACTVRGYDITGRLGYLEPGDEGFVIGKKRLASHGSPVLEQAFTLGAAADPSNLPAQIANVLTLRARGAEAAPVEGPGDTRPRSRKTGRLYIGPLNNRAAVPGDASAANFARPDGDFQTTLLQAGEQLQDSANAAGANWCVWSRTDGAMHAVTSVQVDDSWDVIRSRKRKPTVRLTRTFAPVPPVVLAA